MKLRKVFNRIEEVIGISGHPRRVRDVLEVELHNYFGLPLIQAAEKAEEFEEPIRQLILRSKLENERKGVSPVLTLSSRNEKTVLGSCFIEKNDPPAIAKAKLGRLHIEPILEQIKTLTFKQFENFGARILHELGAISVHVTPHSSDQGIDFYGFLSLGQNHDLPLPFGKLAHDVRLGFAGQAKHYPNKPVGPDMIRELAGSISLARYKIFTKEPDMFDELELTPYNPLVAIFFTTGRFTEGALTLAEKAGIIAKSGEQLAVFLADKGVGIEHLNGSPVFNNQKFLEWLESTSNKIE